MYRVIGPLSLVFGFSKQWAVAVLHRKSKYMARVCVVEVLWPGVVVSVCARAPNDRV